jgi:hypothetical protein
MKNQGMLVVQQALRKEKISGHFIGNDDYGTRECKRKQNGNQLETSGHRCGDTLGWSRHGALFIDERTSRQPGRHVQPGVSGMPGQYALHG